jgi:hypothetical protein
MFLEMFFSATLLFHAPFDGTATAAVAKGAAEPCAMAGLEYAPGKKGSAVRLSSAAQSRLSYAMGGNINRECGTVALWFKREWGRDGEKKWHYLLSNPFKQPRKGTGAFVLWWIDGRLRADVSDAGDSKVYGFNAPPDGEWLHIAWCWTSGEQWLYVNGRRARNPVDAASPTRKAKEGVKDYRFSRVDYGTFDVGSHNGQRHADGLVDDLRIYSAPLSQEEVGLLVKEGGGSVDPPSAPDWKSIFSGSASNAYEGAFAEKAGEFRTEDLELLEEIRLNSPESVAALRESRRFNSVGALRFGSIDGTGYVENGKERWDRWALRLKVDASAPLHVIDVDYPDNALRTMDMLVQPSVSSEDDYIMQVGVACGGEYPSTGRIQTHRCVFWTPRSPSGDVALVVMNPLSEGPAAVSAVRVFRVKGGRLPAAKLNLPPPVNGWRRSLGLFFEDPAVGYDFAVEKGGATEAGLSELIDRTAATMKFTGENLFAYPGAWYHGVIGGKEGYNPRNHAPGFLKAWYTKFDAQGLSIMPTLNVLTMAVSAPPLTAKSLDDGSLHQSCISILDTGRPNDWGWHNTPPVFNFSHPHVQRYIEDMVDTLIAQGREHPSFKGICLHITRHGLLSWGALESGYNDYCIEAFEKARGVRIPCDRSDPMRGKAYWEWIRDNALEEWIDWRCDVFTGFWADIARKLSSVRPDLKLWIACFTTSWIKHGRFLEPDFVQRVNREHGIDAVKLEKAIPNLILAQCIVPADYRRRGGRLDPAAKERQLSLPLERRTFDMLGSASFPWVGQHDRYWETAIGKSSAEKGGPGSLSGGWFKECIWRVCTVNPSGVNAMRHFAEPLRYHDLLGMSKGGFLVGTYGMESHLAKFAQAYLALPAVKMDEFFRSGHVVGRKASCFGRTYGYVVNTGASEATAEVRLPEGAKDCVTGRPIAGPLRLAPYELRSFVE